MRRSSLSALAGFAAGILATLLARPTDPSWDGPVLIWGVPGQPATRLEPFAVVQDGERVVDRPQPAGDVVTVGLPGRGVVMYTTRAE